jgi:transaldolase
MNTNAEMAAYISPFMGRLDDIGQKGLELVRDIVEIYNNYNWKTQVLAASIRHPLHVIETARIGADVATMPFKVMLQLFNHPLTEKGLEQFLTDWRKSA